MAEINMSWQGKKITIIDNGNRRLGTGDAVKIDDSPAREIGNESLANELRDAGLEMEELIGSRIDSLPGLFKTMEQVKYGNADGLKNEPARVRELAWAVHSEAWSRRLYGILLEDSLGSFAKEFKVLTSEAILSRFYDIAGYAVMAGIKISLGHINAVTIPYLASELCLKMVERAKSESSRQKWRDEGRYFAHEAGIPFDASAAGSFDLHYPPDYNPIFPFMPSPTHERKSFIWGETF
ncbi:MAG: hypothetical protein WC956_01335 [bacterium]